MKKLLILHLGGNIALSWNKDSQSTVYPAMDSRPEILQKMLSESITGQEEVDFKNICFKDSREVSNDDREALLKAIIGDEAASAYMITHGADTIRDTAAYLRENLPADFTKPVALVSSHSPASEIDNWDEPSQNEAYKNMEAAWNKLDELCDAGEAGIYACVADAEVVDYAFEEAQQ